MLLLLHGYAYHGKKSRSMRSLVVIVNASTLVELLLLRPQISSFINASQSALLVKSFHLAYGGLCFTTTSIPSSSDLSRLKTFIHSIAPEESTVCCKILSSHSFCKLMAILFLQNSKPITSKNAKTILHSTVYKNSICLMAPSRIVHNF